MVNAQDDHNSSTVGIGFNGAETNRGIAHILGIPLMNSCNTVIFLATTIICTLSTLKSNGIGNDVNHTVSVAVNCEYYIQVPLVCKSFPVHTSLYFLF